VDRRTFLRDAAWLAAIGPAVALGQPRKVPRIGYLSLQSKSDQRLDAFLSGLRDLGYIDGKTITIEWRFTNGDAGRRLAGYAEELVRMKPDLIVAVHPQAVEAVRRLTSAIPIVFTVGQDPVGMGFAKSLAHPGGNITGHSSMASDIGLKHIELLQATLPKCTRVSVLLNPTNRAGAAVLRKSYEAAAEKFGVMLAFHHAQNRDELRPAVLEAKGARAQALVVTPDGVLLEQSAEIANAALEQGLPSLFFQREAAQAGGLLSYGPNGREQYRRTAYYVDRILNGAKPGDLPIEQPTSFNLIVNLKAAREIDVTVPRGLVLRASEVLE
jgi:putative ABC transport system substrate-binding protein